MVCTVLDPAWHPRLLLLTSAEISSLSTESMLTLPNAVSCSDRKRQITDLHVSSSCLYKIYQDWCQKKKKYKKVIKTQSYCNWQLTTWHHRNRANTKPSLVIPKSGENCQDFEKINWLSQENGGNEMYK